LAVRSVAAPEPSAGRSDGDAGAAGQCQRDAPQQKPEVPEPNMPAQRILVDWPGRIDDADQHERARGNEDGPVDPGSAIIRAKSNG
jgi:hypothetical protein